MTTTATAPPPHLARGTCQATPGVRVWWDTPADYQAAAELCTAGCRVLNECLIWAVVNEPGSGIWGGFTKAQRARLARAADAPPRWPPRGRHATPLAG